MESKELISDGTTGLRTWAAGKFLYAWLSGKTQVTHGKRVLELGCGAGFTGIALLNDPGGFYGATFVFCPDHEFYSKVTIDGSSENLAEQFTVSIQHKKTFSDYGRQCILKCMDIVSGILKRNKSLI